MKSLVRCVLLAATGAVLGMATLAGFALVGFNTTMARDFARVHAQHSVVGDSSARAPRPGRIQTAILLGRNGSVATDVMGPYSVFAGSPKFDVRTVSSARSPVALSGGLTVMPEATYDDYQSGRLPLPDLVVVPAITEPAGSDEAELRAFIESVHAAGRMVMGVCAGARVLVETGVLYGKKATSFWSDLDGMKATHPETIWVGGTRWVEDANVVTTAGVSSGIAASLHVVHKLAGPDEAIRIADTVRYPHWIPNGTMDIPIRTISLSDYPYALGATIPWGQPRYGLGLTPGVDEIDIAAAADVYGGVAFTAQVIPVAETDEIVTKHGMRLRATPIADAGRFDRLIIPAVTSSRLPDATHPTPVFLPAAESPGNTSFDPILADVARTDGRRVAETAAKYLEYPLPPLPDESGYPVRVTTMAILVFLASAGMGLVPFLISRTRRGMAWPYRLLAARDD